ncbi:MAG TPA: hypothetical protein VHG69_03820 [Thermoleophilaceae bacterium]|nr:hypothetical protein [Thermoleophilaceae bacterium]
MNYDPDSPAGQEYSVPLDEARRAGGPPAGSASTDRDSNPGSQGAAPFGAGITAGDGEGGGVASGGGRETAPSRDGRSGGGRDAGRRAAAPVTEALDATVSAQGVTGVALASLVAAIALGLGLIIRRRQRLRG